MIGKLERHLSGISLANNHQVCPRSLVWFRQRSLKLRTWVRVPSRAQVFLTRKAPYDPWANINMWVDHPVKHKFAERQRSCMTGFFVLQLRHVNKLQPQGGLIGPKRYRQKARFSVL